jgi:putative cardiolipin synthase
MQRARARIAAYVIATACVATGCAPAPVFDRAAPGHAIPAGVGTPLDREVLQDRAIGPGVTALRLVQQNPLAFAYRVETARRAGRSIDAQYYIWNDDLTGRTLAAELMLAAERGVRVRLLLDDLDVNALRAMLVVADAHPNLEVRLFNPMHSDPGGPARIGEWLGRAGRLNHRMHNKLWIADNRIAILGGRNIGDEYFGASGHTNFSDTGLVIGGAAVADASRAFDEYWNSDSVVPVSAFARRQPGPDALATLLADSAAFLEQARTDPYTASLRDAATLSGLMQRRQHAVHAQAVEIVADDPAKPAGAARGRAASRVLDRIAHLLESATREVLVFSPYFVPGDAGTRMLAGIARRGVRVAVLTNSLAATDVAAVHAGYQRYRARLLRAGVELYEMKPAPGDADDRRRISLTGSSLASLHTKALVVDGHDAFVGSMNFDPRSVNLNTEIGAFVASPGIAAQLRAQFGEATAPQASYRLELHADGRLLWHDVENGAARAQEGEPQATFARRALVGLLRLLPIESQL